MTGNQRRQNILAELNQATGPVNATKLAEMNETLASALGDSFSLEKILQAANTAENTGDMSFLNDQLDAIMSGIDFEIGETTKTALGGKVGEMWKSVLDQGHLEGTSFDVSGASSQLASLFEATISSAEASAIPKAQSAGAELGKASTSQMSDAAGARAAGNETVNGLDSALARAESRAYKRGQAAGRAFASGYKAEQVIQSPSKVMMRLGEYSGEGLEIGLRNSMTRAVNVAKQMSGQIVTAADISQSMRVANMPNLQQEIISANEQNKTPVYLDGYKIAEIQGYNNSTTIAWNNTRASKGVGGR
jgi:hypothetical protein